MTPPKATYRFAFAPPPPDHLASTLAIVECPEQVTFELRLSGQLTELQALALARQLPHTRADPHTAIRHALHSNFIDIAYIPSVALPQLAQLQTSVSGVAHLPKACAQITLAHYHTLILICEQEAPSVYPAGGRNPFRLTTEISGCPGQPAPPITAARLAGFSLNPLDLLIAATPAHDSRQATLDQ